VRSIYAAGGVTGRSGFAQAAGHEAARAVRDMFFPGRGSLPDLVPWCTFTDPELARVGPTADEAEQRHGDGVDVWRFDLGRTDRARADGVSEAAVVVVTARSRIVGAHVLAPHAGEMIHELALAVRRGLRLDDVAALVHAHPTLSSGVGQLATDSAFERAAKLRWLVKKER
jgi:pyruvate/2-oxoglutarate dehydrogenase complex dihydrolipoamide dehydrogenase (E3) component